MPWIPNLLLHDKPVPLSNMRSLGRTRVVVSCGNPDCHHNAELDVSGLPDDMTFNDLQPRMAIIAAPTSARRGCYLADWSRPFEDPIPFPDGGQFVTLLDAGNYITGLPKADQQLDLTQPPREE